MKVLLSFLQWVLESDLRFVFRIVLAGICGFAIGYERKNRAKGAGIRTHFIVATSAALMMVISKYGFLDVGGGDPARLAAQIVSGVGFLGAGMIFVQKQTVTGLTTAAGIWATSGIGMAIGAGLYMVGIATTVVIVVAQIFLHSHYTWLQTAKIRNLFVYEVADENFCETSEKMLKKHGISVLKTNVGRNAETGNKDYMFTLEVPPKITEDDLLDLFESYSCKIKAKD